MQRNNIRPLLIKASFWIYMTITFLSIYVIGRVPEAAGFGAVTFCGSLAWLFAYTKANYFERPASGKDANLSSAEHHINQIVTRRAA